MVYKYLCGFQLSIPLSVYPEVELLSHVEILCLIFLSQSCFQAQLGRQPEDSVIGLPAIAVTWRNPTDAHAQPRPRNHPPSDGIEGPIFFFLSPLVIPRYRHNEESFFMLVSLDLGLYKIHTLAKNSDFFKAPQS